MNNTVASTVVVCADLPVPTAPVIAPLFVASPSDGSTCHTPNKADETMVAVVVPLTSLSSPHSTPRKASSSTSTVPIGISTSEVSSAFPTSSR